MRQTASFRRITPRLGLALCVLLAGCFTPSPEKMNGWIDSGSSAKALEEIEKQLAKDPGNPTLHLLAAKAILAICAQNNCTSTNPDMLQPVAAHLTMAPGEISLSAETPPLTATSVLAAALPTFAELKPQPAGMLELFNAVPAAQQAQVMDALFLPALNNLRNTQAVPAAESLNALSRNESLPKPASLFAIAIVAMLDDNETAFQSQLIGLRNMSGSIPGGAGALIPWTLLTQARQAEISGASEKVLEALPTTIQSWNISETFTGITSAGLANELNTIRTTPPLLAKWQSSWTKPETELPLTLQRLSLSLNPNQPDLWASFLPTLIRSVSGTVTELTQSLGFASFSSSTLPAASQQKLAVELMKAASQLQDNPGAAAPLLMLTSTLKLEKLQQIELDKLTQAVLIKAANTSDITATTFLAKFKPDIALNNRQTVVPLLVASIRQNLKAERFDEAVKIADLLQTTLQLDVQLDPILLQEFADDMKRRNIGQDLAAENADFLLQPADAVALDLGPLFKFLTIYFADQPNIITSQLTTLVAGAAGDYGPASAMYRLNHLFPEEGMPAEQRTEWLHQAITQALTTDERLTGPETATLISQLLAVHPNLPTTPLLEVALTRSRTVEDGREIWQHASASMRKSIEAIRPQFALLMRGIDSLQAKRLNAAATAFSQITEPQWFTEAQPYIAQLQEKLADIAGIYVPVSAATTLKTGAIFIAPVGLQSSDLTQISVTFLTRMGSYSQNDPYTLTATPAALRKITLSIPIDLDSMRLILSPEVFNQSPEASNFTAAFGPIQSLALQPSSEGGKKLLQVSLGGGTVNANTTFLRTIVDPSLPLRPDGTYLIQGKLNTPVSGTQTILPLGTVLIFHTGTEARAPSAEWQTSAASVYSLSGTVNHPASGKPLMFEGFFDPATLSAEFLLTYPLPQSGQPVKAVVRCQFLAGPLVCGSHHVHSARQRFATLVAGMQTQESLAKAAIAREETNTAARQAMLNSASQFQPKQMLVPAADVSVETTSPTEVSTTTPASTSGTAQLLSPSGIKLLPPPSATDTETPEGYTFKAAPSRTTPIPTSPSATLADFMPAPETSSPTAPEPKTLTIKPGEAISGTVKPGTFIHKTTAKPLAP